MYNSLVAESVINVDVRELRRLGIDEITLVALLSLWCKMYILIHLPL